MQIEGVYVPVVTPFTAADHVDEAAHAAVIERCLNAGVAGIVSCGTTGEYYALSDEERIHVFDLAHQVNAGRAQMVAGCNAGSTKQVIHFGLAAKQIGYDALMLAAPATSLPRQHELAAHFTRVADEVGLPIILYNYPARAGVEIGFECLDAVADHPGIVAIKESSSDFSRFLAMRRRYSSRMTIMCGSDDQAADYFFWGVRSWLAGTGNVLPQEHVDMVNAANGGDHDKAREIFDKILPWVQHMEEGRYNQKVKVGLKHLGIDCGGVRQPMLPLSDEEVTALLAELDAATA